MTPFTLHTIAVVCALTLCWGCTVASLYCVKRDPAGVVDEALQAMGVGIFTTAAAAFVLFGVATLFVPLGA